MAGRAGEAGGGCKGAAKARGEQWWRVRRRTAVARQAIQTASQVSAMARRWHLVRLAAAAAQCDGEAGLAGASAGSEQQRRVEVEQRRRLGAGEVQTAVVWCCNLLLVGLAR